MSKARGNIIDTKECESCIYGVLNESNKARILIYCKARNKNYSFGQFIPCDERKTIEETGYGKNALAEKN